MKILDKIKKLIAHADSAKQMGSFEEAKAFMEKAQELMNTHNLSMLDVLRHAQQQGEAERFKDYLIGEKIYMKENLAGSRWKCDLIKVLAHHNLTNVMFHNNNNKEYATVYGEGQHVEVVQYLFNFLSIHLLNLAKQSRATDPASATLCRHTYLKNFLIGAISGLQTQLLQQASESKFASQLNEIMVLNSVLLEQYKKKAWPDSFLKASKRIEVGAGYDKGVNAGENVQLGNRLAAEKVAEKRLLK
jgi:hypothetical protein